ncbi:SulP family inorganic anion transporter [Pseudogemmobacter sonorensis]|uniref:SulP family inorganic anion transporter n=1 Tax=Pseudogemmobacter sonorensis TaxID=2989681 RepID=UPI0036812B89
MTQTPRNLNIRAELLPKLVTTLREGYGRADLRADAMAGLTVAIVALPLSMAIAIASGVGPERGLYTAIVGGALVSAFGGSRYQIGGPAGAFIVLVSACVMQLGIPGLITATFLSGFVLILAGLLRLGSYIRYIPYPVTLAFTAGIGVIILASQMKDLFGLSLAGAEPAELVEKVHALWAARESVSWPAFGVAMLVVGVILGLRRWRPHWPGMLVAVVLASVLVAALSLPVETIATRFGRLPNLLPAPALPGLDAGLIRAALPYALSFALLGAIESLLSAVVADGMSGGRHRSNAELVGQGVANIGSALFGGFCVTGTIARTATNVRAGSRGPVSGILHALFLLVFLAVAAPLAGYVPLAALAGVLVVVAWGMIERAEILALVRGSRADAAIIVTTFALVAFRDLTEGIVVGFAMAGLVFIKRMSDSTALEHGAPPPSARAPETQSDGRLVYRLHGPLFFGAAAQVGSVLDRIAERPEEMVFDFTDVPLIDSSGAHSFELLARKVAGRGGRVQIVGARPEVRRILFRQGLRPPLVGYHARLPSPAPGAGETA